MSKTSEPEIEVMYFPVRGRAEPIRMTLAIAGVKFKDVRVTGEDWAQSVKQQTPYGQMPCLKYNGKIHGESKAIASFVARHCGMAGKSPVDAMRVDEVYCLFGCFLEAMAKASYEKDEAKKEEMKKALDAEIIPKYLNCFENKLKETGDGYFVASKLSQADLTVYDITYSLLNQNPKVLDDFPEIRKMRKNLEGIPKVKAYLDCRPDSKF